LPAGVNVKPATWPASARNLWPPIGHTICKVVGHFKYAQGWAIKGSKAKPSRNHLVNCPDCPRTPLAFCVWSYNVQRHYAARHPNTELVPPELKAEVQISAGELTAVQTRGSASKATRKRSGKEKAEQEGRRTAMRARAAEEEEREQEHNLRRGMRQAAMVAAGFQGEQSSTCMDCSE
jgi:type IV secretory pathway VirB10-like protein